MCEFDNLELVGIFLGRQAHFFLEGTDEMGIVVKTDFSGYKLDGHFLFEQFPGLVDAAIDQVLDHTVSGCFFKNGLQIIFVNIEMIRNLAPMKGFGPDCYGCN